MTNDVALVVGASRGIGRGIAGTLHNAGWRVALVGRRTDAVVRAAEELKRSGGTVVGITGDVSTMEGAALVHAETEAALGQAPAVLVHSAGIFGPIAPVADVKAEDWRSVIETNLLSAFYLTRLTLPGMLDAGWGRVIYVSSKAAVQPPGSGASSYAISKLALNRLAGEVAAEVHGTGVTANSIHPGEVKTDMWADIRARARLAGTAAQDLARWAEEVDQTGGDPIELSSQMVAWLVDHGEVNGLFLLPDDWRALSKKVGAS